MNETGLIRYDAMCHAIAECYSVDEVKEIRSKARAWEVYAAQAMNLDAEIKATEIRIRAEKRGGQLLIEMKRNGTRDKGGYRKKNLESSRTTQAQTLTDLGISKTQSSQWQKLANIPDEEFEAELAKPGKPTTEGILASLSQPAQMDPKPLVDLQGRDPEDFAEATTAQGNVRRLAEYGSAVDLKSIRRGLLPHERKWFAKEIEAAIKWLQSLDRLMAGMTP